MRFYTNTFVRGNNVYIRGYNNGNRFNEKVFYKPTLYEPSRGPTKFKTIDGHTVKPKQFESIKACKEYVSKFEDVDGFNFYGSTLHAYTFINDKFDNDYDMDHIRVANIDIEVGSEDGFPEPEDANQPITAITIKQNGICYVMGIDDFKNDRKDVQYINCKTEHKLIDIFLKTWKKLDPDIITGWNTRFFDIPYLVNRITKIFGEYKANELKNLVKDKKEIDENIIEKQFDVIDARNIARFEGEVKEPRLGLRSGNIKNSSCIPFNELININKTFKTKKEIAEIFNKILKNINSNTVVFSCGSGVTACVLALAYSLINDKYLPKIYDGSWAEYGKI